MERVRRDVDQGTIHTDMFALQPEGQFGRNDQTESSHKSGNLSVPTPTPKNELSKQLMNQLVSQSFGPSVDQEFIGSNSP